MPGWLVVALWLGGGPSLEPTDRFPKGLRRTPLETTSHHDGPTTVAACAECHADVAQRWSLSGHATAASHFVFRASVRQEQHPDTCIRCHAPNGAPVAASNEAARPNFIGADSRGVGCAACHVDEGRVRARRSSPPPYPVTADPAMTDGRLCAGCHQFGFVIRDGSSIVGLTGPQHQQQDTYRQWRRWSAGTPNSKSCVDCHFRDHTFGGKRRYADLRRALRVAYDRTTRILNIATSGVGHPLPTGDIMRWIEVVVSEDDAFAPGTTRRVAAFRRTLAHRDWHDGHPPHLGIDTDVRLAPDATTPVAVPAGAWTRWRIIYHLLPESYERTGVLPSGMSARIIHEGELR